MNTKRLIPLAALAATFAAAAAAPSDGDFAKEAAGGGMAEVADGHLAETHGQSEAVKAFGRRMVQDHSKANAQLKAIAKKQGIALPTSEPSDEKAATTRLTRLNGKEFDDAYAKMMVEDHEKDVAAFRKESESGANPAIKAFAARTLPTLEHHLELARKLP